MAWLGPYVDATEPEVANGIVDSREYARRQIALFGGDPLPDEQILLSVEKTGTIIIIWRSFVGPERQDLFAAITSYADSLDNITRWTLEYHVCGNGRKRQCSPWQLLTESER
jgi:hypothetical protein